MENEKSGNRLVLGCAIAAGIALAVGLWFWRSSGPVPNPSHPTETRSELSASQGGTVEKGPASAGRIVAAPNVMISDGDRLQVTADALREGEVLALGLRLPDELRGDRPRPTQIVDISGRVLEVDAVAIDGMGTGVRLEIDPSWLKQGTYMIQVETAEKRPLALRRYVLEIVDNDEAR